jgi:hypothetical protein
MLTFQLIFIQASELVPFLSVLVSLSSLGLELS